MNIFDRLKAKTPRFFRIVRNIGLLQVGGGELVLAAPVELPELTSAVVDYSVVCGLVMIILSQLTVDEKADPKE